MKWPKTLGSPPLTYHLYGEATTLNPTTQHLQRSLGPYSAQIPRSSLPKKTHANHLSVTSCLPITTICFSDKATIRKRLVLFNILHNTVIQRVLHWTLYAESTPRDRENEHPTISPSVGQSMWAQPAYSMPPINSDSSSTNKLGPKPIHSSAPGTGGRFITKTPLRPFQ